MKRRINKTTGTVGAWFEKISAIIFFIVLTAVPVPASADSEHSHVGNPAPPLLSVGDVDGSGLVDETDKELVRLAVMSGDYGSLYDRNGDHRLTQQDILTTELEFGLESTPFDRQLVEIYHRFAWTQDDAWQSFKETLLRFGPTKGEGYQWLTNDGLNSFINFKNPTFDTLEVAIGPNDGTPPWGLQLFSTAVPGFDNPFAVDFPFVGGVWEMSNVISFLNQPPQVTLSED